MRGTGSAPTAVGGGHGPGRLAPVLGLAQGLALVPVLLAPGQGDLELGAAFQEVQLQGDDRIALGLAFWASFSSSGRWSRSLRLRRGVWLFQVPCKYSGM